MPMADQIIMRPVEALIPREVRGDLRPRHEGQVSEFATCSGSHTSNAQGRAIATFLAAGIASRVGHSAGVNSASRWISAA
jgi:hypothetical protein